jgi:AmiR/NasT family two-component response regulator
MGVMFACQAKKLEGLKKNVVLLKIKTQDLDIIKNLHILQNNAKQFIISYISITLPRY